VSVSTSPLALGQITIVVRNLREPLVFYRLLGGVDSEDLSAAHRLRELALCAKAPACAEGLAAALFVITSLEVRK
jgi:hypothetical protein